MIKTIVIVLALVGLVVIARQSQQDPPGTPPVWSKNKSTKTNTFVGPESPGAKKHREDLEKMKATQAGAQEGHTMAARSVSGSPQESPKEAAGAKPEVTVESLTKDVQERDARIQQLTQQVQYMDGRIEAFLKLYGHCFDDLTVDEGKLKILIPPKK